MFIQANRKQIKKGILQDNDKLYTSSFSQVNIVIKYFPKRYEHMVSTQDEISTIFKLCVTSFLSAW